MDTESGGDDSQKTEDLTKSAEGGTDMMPNGGSGEDGSGGPKDGDHSRSNGDPKPKRD